MTRAAFVCADPGVPVFGSKGCSIHAQQLIASLRKRGVELELFVANAQGRPANALAGLRVHDLGIEKRSSTAARERQLVAANEGLAQALRSAGPFDFVYERHALFSHAAMDHARRAGVPGLLEINAPLIDEQLRHRSLVDLPAAERARTRAFSAASHLLPVSHELARKIEAQGAVRDRIHITPNGVDPSVFPERRLAACGSGSSGFTIGFLGTLRPWHGASELVEGFRQVAARRDDARLLVVGSGGELDALKRRLSELGLIERCRFTGSVQHAEVPQLLASMDVGVAPYPHSEDFYFSPLKILEYMAAGLPVVASRIGQIPLLVRDGVDGLLHEPGDTQRMADLLLRLARDPALGVALGREARRRVAAKHSWDQVADRVLALASLQLERRGQGAA